MNSRVPFIIFSILFFTIILIPDNSFALFEQSFSVPIEKETVLGKAINSYFHDFVSSSLYQGLLKAGFMLAVFLAIFKYGFRAGNAFRDFLAYVMTFFLIVMPLPGVGKSLPIILVDSLDNLTSGVITKLGHTPVVAGQGMMFVTAENFARNYAYSRHADKANRLLGCYKQVVADANRKGLPIPKASDINQYDNYYEEVKGEMKNCKVIAQETMTALKVAYGNGLDKYAKQAEKMGLSTDKLRTELEKLQVNVPPEELLQGAMQYAKDHPEATAELDKKVGFWDALNGFINFLSSIFSTEGVLSLVTIVPRIILAIMGMISLFFFDYYVYHIVALLKIAAAIGIALGVLYFAFLGRLDMLIGSIGAWMFGNATYIVASILMVNFWDRVDGGLASTFLFILGQPGPLTDALPMLAFGFMLYGTLASIMTWKGVSLSLKIPSVPDMFIWRSVTTPFSGGKSGSGSSSGGSGGGSGRR